MCTSCPDARGSLNGVLHGVLGLKLKFRNLGEDEASRGQEDAGSHGSKPSCPEDTLNEAFGILSPGLAGYDRTHY